MASSSEARSCFPKKHSPLLFSCVAVLVVPVTSFKFPHRHAMDQANNCYRSCGPSRSTGTSDNLVPWDRQVNPSLQWRWRRVSTVCIAVVAVLASVALVRDEWQLLSSARSLYLRMSGGDKSSVKVRSFNEDTGDGGWDPTDVQGASIGAYCNIPRVDASPLSREAFAEQYLERAPVILVGATDPTVFRGAVTREALLRRMANCTITLSSANKNSYAKKEIPLREYLDGPYMRPQTTFASGADSWYLFGDHHLEHWKALFALYESPNRFIFGPHRSLSFGIGAAGSGVPFHTHGHVFNEVLYGKKRWWLQAPSSRVVADDEHEGGSPRFDPDASTLQWLTFVKPTYSAAENARLWECVCEPGEMLYIPSMWHHATLNIGETVFMAVFV